MERTQEKFSAKKNYYPTGFEPRSYKKTAEYTLRATTILPTPTTVTTVKTKARNDYDYTYPSEDEDEETSPQVQDVDPTQDTQTGGQTQDDGEGEATNLAPIIIAVVIIGIIAAGAALFFLHFKKMLPQGFYK